MAHILQIALRCGTSADLRPEGPEGTLTVGPGNYLKLDAQTARNLAAHLEDAADAMEASES